MRLAFTMCRAVSDTRVSDTCGNTHYGFIVVRRISSRLVALVPLGPAAAAVAGRVWGVGLSLPFVAIGVV